MSYSTVFLLFICSYVHFPSTLRHFFFPAFLSLNHSPPRRSNVCLVGGTRRAPSRHSRDSRVNGHTTTAMHKLSTPPPRALQSPRPSPPPPPHFDEGSETTAANGTPISLTFRHRSPAITWHTFLLHFGECISARVLGFAARAREPSAPERPFTWFFSLPSPSPRPASLPHFFWSKVNVLAYEYSGYGKSEGTVSEENCYADIRAAYDYLTTQKKVLPQQIVL